MNWGVIKASRFLTTAATAKLLKVTTVATRNFNSISKRFTYFNLNKKLLVYVYSLERSTKPEFQLNNNVLCCFSASKKNLPKAYGAMTEKHFARNKCLNMKMIPQRERHRVIRNNAKIRQTLFYFATLCIVVGKKKKLFFGTSVVFLDPVLLLLGPISASKTGSST